jgi:hypothetical protein
MEQYRLDGFGRELCGEICINMGRGWRAVECREEGNAKGKRRLELVNHLNGN